MDYRDPRTPPAQPTPTEIRRWAIENGITVSPQGRIAHRNRAAHAAALPGEPDTCTSRQPPPPKEASS
ncbi:Lsr2 family DNA-binding protein [Microbacterium galbinum]|uniref:Lsr2 family DNA-binding protein n=1 Tax=Microbacterium galbinum TaxID=2851646 RepID=UPI003FD6D23E